VSAQIDRLRRILHTHLGAGFVVENADLTELDPAERESALDAIVAGTLSPFVFVGGSMVCSGAVDAPAVLAALAR
jgi:hypothetical protein